MAKGLSDNKVTLSQLLCRYFKLDEDLFVIYFRSFFHFFPKLDIALIYNTLNGQIGIEIDNISLSDMVLLLK